MLVFRDSQRTLTFYKSDSFGSAQKPIKETQEV